MTVPCGAPGDLVVGIEEQGFLVGVQVVEGRARDARELGDVEDAHGPVAAAGDQLDHRRAQAFALVALDLLGVESVRARGQPPVALGGIRRCAPVPTPRDGGRRALRLTACV